MSRPPRTGLSMGKARKKKALDEIWRQIQGAHLNAHCKATGNRGVAYFGPDEIDLLWDIVEAFEEAQPS